MEDNSLVNVSNDEIQTIGVEIFCPENDVNLEFTSSFEAALSVHNSEDDAHPYLIERLTEKVDVEQNKGLSTNDFTDELKGTYDGYSASITANTDNIGALEDLTTTTKNTLVASINEINSKEIPQKATTAEAEAGLDDTKFMTPLKTLECINTKVSMFPQYTLNSCKLDNNGKADLLAYSGSALSFNVTSTDNLTLTNKATKREFTSLANIIVSSLADGTYIPFVKDDSTVELININNYKVQPNVETTLTNGNVRLDNSVLPLKLLKVGDSAEIEYNATPMTGAQVTVASGVITAIKQPWLNVNGAKRELVEKYVNGTEWYELYTDGYIRQGGEFYIGYVSTAVITLLKPYTNTQYGVFTQSTQVAYNDASNNGNKITTKTPTQFTASNHEGAGAVMWSSYGY